MKKMLFIGWLIGVLFSACTSFHAPETKTDRQPALFPDYADVTFPPNMAPPNFRICEPAEAYQVEIGCGDRVEIYISNDRQQVRIPVRKWRELMRKAAGKDVFFRISIRQKGHWTVFNDVVNHIAVQPIDPVLVYRLLYPGYELWNEMGIYQRDLTSYAEIPVAANRDFEGQCVNCHTFRNHSSDTMMLHVRGPHGGTLIRRDATFEKMTAKIEGNKLGATYPAWHPSGKYIAYSLNEIQQFFHSSGRKAIEVADLAADIVVYDLETQQMFSDSLLCSDRYMDTFPSWSPDGTSLYFCRSRAYEKGDSLDRIRYDFCRVQFDAEQRKFHSFECLYAASAEEKSVSFPRVSPDGKYLMFVRMDYGNFSIWHPESDLFLFDLENRSMRVLDEVNSDDVESYHTWSSSGHWFVFSSKRLDGLWARPYFAYFDTASGRTGKPFLLPQEDPGFYDTFTFTYNVPELVKAPIGDIGAIVRAINE